MNKIFRKNRLPVLLHILAWFVLLILPQIIVTRYWGNTRFIPWDFYATASVYGFIFYLNYLWLVPKFYFKDKKSFYFIFAAVIVLLLYFVFIYLDRMTHNPARDKAFEDAIKKLSIDRDAIRPPMRFFKIYSYGLISTIITGFAIGMKVIERHSASEKRQKELEKEKLHSELAFLKNQVSPHFFFNTLNNIYSLIEINTNDAQDAVMKLSRLMRYLLYESQQETTLLSHEVNFMKHYIDLMKLRLSAKVDLAFSFPEKEITLQVPPMLFIPFIENAFKHGISYREKSFIHISLEVLENKILFKCHNSQGRKPDEKFSENHSGIGLDNVKKRLGLLFPSSHKLTITDTENDFQVVLELNLNPE